MQSRRTTKALLLMIMTLFWLAQYVYVPFHTPYLLLLGASSSFAGIVVGAYGVTQMICRIPVGMLTDKNGRFKRMIGAGLLCAMLASFLRLQFPVPAVFLVANLLSGITSSAWVSLTVFYTSLHDENTLKKATGHILAFNNIGMLLGFLLSLTVTDDSRIGIVFAASIAAALCGWILLFFVKPPPRETALPQAIPLKGLLKSKRLLFYSTIALVLQAVILSTALSFTTTFAEQFAAVKADLPLCMIVFQLTTVFSALFVGRIKRVGVSAVLAMLLVAIAASCVALPLSASMTHIYIWQGLAGLGNGGVMTLSMALALEGVNRAYKATAMGVFQAVYAVGMTFGPMLMGALVEGYGFTTGYWTMGALLLIAAALVVAARRIGTAQNQTDIGQSASAK